MSQKDYLGKDGIIPLASRQDETHWCSGSSPLPSLLQRVLQGTNHIYTVRKTLYFEKCHNDRGFASVVSGRDSAHKLSLTLVGPLDTARVLTFKAKTLPGLVLVPSNWGLFGTITAAESSGNKDGSRSKIIKEPETDTSSEKHREMTSYIKTRMSAAETQVRGISSDSF